MQQRILTAALRIMMRLGCSTSPKDQPTNRTADSGPGRDTSTAKSLRVEAPDLLDEGDRTKAEAKLGDAIDYYREALKIQPDNPELIGNLARAKHQRGDKDDEQRELLQDLIFKDTRPQWRAWAREQMNQFR